MRRHYEEIRKRIGLNGEYEEYGVHGTDNFLCEVSEYTLIDELNRMYEMIEELPEDGNKLLILKKKKLVSNWCHTSIKWQFQKYLERANH